MDLVVPAGAVLGLRGKNGAGKTTLIKCMLGLALRLRVEVLNLEDIFLEMHHD